MAAQYTSSFKDQNAQVKTSSRNILRAVSIHGTNHYSYAVLFDCKDTQGSAYTWRTR